MSDQPFDPDQEMHDVARAMKQAGELAATMLQTAADETISRRVYERVAWAQVNDMAAAGWELTAVMSEGQHVMQRRVGPAEQVAGALSQILGISPG